MSWWPLGRTKQPYLLRWPGWARTGDLLLGRDQQVARPRRRVNRLQRLVCDAGHKGNALDLLEDVNATAELLHSTHQLRCKIYEQLTERAPAGAPPWCSHAGPPSENLRLRQ